jgi:hypothetical protein
VARLQQMNQKVVLELRFLWLPSFQEFCILAVYHSTRVILMRIEQLSPQNYSSFNRRKNPKIVLNYPGFFKLKKIFFLKLLFISISQ